MHSAKAIIISWELKNTVISPNFLVWTFCGKAQFPQSFGRRRNYAETVFRQNFHTRKLGQITVFYAVNTTQGHFVYSRIAWRFCIDIEQKERNLARNIFKSNCFKDFVFMHVRIYCFKGQSESSFKIVILSSYTCYELHI